MAALVTIPLQVIGIGAAATTLTGGAGIDQFEVGAGFRASDPANTMGEAYETVTITDFNPVTETLVVTEATTESIVTLEQHGDDTWVVLTSAKAGYEEYRMVATVLQNVATTDVAPDAISLRAIS